MKKSFFSFVALILFSMPLFAQSISLVPFISSGLVKPLDIKHAGDSRIFIVEQDGRIRISDSLGNLNPTSFLDINPAVGSTGNEQGLLGLAFHPNYVNNGFFFVNYTDNSGDTHISRFRVSAGNANIADPLSEVELLKIEQPYSNHNGGNMMFGPDGYLYVFLGDGGSAGDPGNRAQNLDTLLGKSLRLDVDLLTPPYYKSPTTNPFYGAAPGRDEIWAFGLRNPWKASFDKITGDMWIGDVGQNAWEEIDFQSASSTGGENYGWKCKEGLVNYGVGCIPTPVVVPPVAVYDHSGGGCSVTGGYVYRGAVYGGLWGYYLYIDYCSGVMRSIISDGAGGWTINNSVGNFTTFVYTAFGEDYLGEMYVAQRSPGAIYKIKENASCFPVAFITMSDTLQACDSTVLSALHGNGHTYSWIKDGVAIPSATASQYTATTNGWYSVAVTNTSPCTSTSDSVYVNINLSPVVDLNGLASSYCQNEDSVLLSGTPALGTFSGSVSSSGYFNPNAAGAGTKIITYEFTSTAGCSSSDMDTTDVFPIPSASFSVNDTLHGCDSLLLQAATATGATHQWSRDGVDLVGAINPSYTALLDGWYGLETILGTCNDQSDTVYVYLTPTPTVSFSGLDTVYCIYNSASSLTGSPSGGTFSGPGITGNTFNPGDAGTGSHTIQYSYTDGDGCSANASLSVSIDSCTNIGSLKNSLGLKIIPNPSSGQIKIEWNVNSEIQFIEIYSLLGEKIFHSGDVIENFNSNYSIDLTSLPSGMYFLGVQTKNEKIIEKIILNR